MQSTKWILDFYFRDIPSGDGNQHHNGQQRLVRSHSTVTGEFHLIQSEWVTWDTEQEPTPEDNAMIRPPRTGISNQVRKRKNAENEAKHGTKAYLLKDTGYGRL
jgi:hypothetical protein